MPLSSRNGVLCSVAALVAAMPVSAQVNHAPAGTIERDARAGAPSPVPRAPEKSPIKDDPKATGKSFVAACASDNCVEVHAFRFSGNSLFSEAELESVARAANPKATAYDLAGLRGAAAAVTRFYRQKGYLVATAWIPPQQAGDGSILIRIAEGALSTPDAVLAAPTAQGKRAVKAAAVVRRKLCGDAACDDVVLRQGRIESALLTTGDALGVNVTAQLAPGVQEGSSLLYVDTAARNEPFLTVGADNFGSRSVGRYQFSGNLSLANLVADGDRLSGQALTTQKGDVASGGLQYSMPVALTGARVAIGGFYSNYSLTGAFAPLGAHGRSYGGTGSLSWTVLRRADSYLNLSTSLEVARLSDVMLGLTNARVHWAWRAGIDGQFSDVWFGTPAQTQMQLSLVRTRLDFEDVLFDRGKTGGTATKLLGKLVRAQSLTHGFTLSALATGQLASRNLDPYDKLTISGPSGVRAYPIGEYGGDRALVTQFALGWATPVGKLGVLSLQGFYDAGWARLQIDPVSPTGNTVHLDGAGAQLSLARQNGYALSLFWARAVSTPASQIDGHRDRVGASLNYAF